MIAEYEYLIKVKKLPYYSLPLAPAKYFANASDYEKYVRSTGRFQTKCTGNTLFEIQRQVLQQALQDFGVPQTAYCSEHEDILKMVTRSLNNMRDGRDLSCFLVRANSEDGHFVIAFQVIIQ
jgi:hypothetical protein